MLPETAAKVYHPKHRSYWPKHECVICGSKAIGINFGAPSCAPCKAFFRRNARRREILQTPCPFRDTYPPSPATPTGTPAGTADAATTTTTTTSTNTATTTTTTTTTTDAAAAATTTTITSSSSSTTDSNDSNATISDTTTTAEDGTDQKGTYCSQVRYCSSCRLRRCYDMGMKEELVRTDEENERYRQLVETNRKRRQQTSQHENTVSLPPYVVKLSDLLHETDWVHISNIVFAYEAHCLKTYIQQRTDLFATQLRLPEDPDLKINYHTTTTVNNLISFKSFLTSIPTIQSLSKIDRTFLCKHNIRPLILLNLHELEQLCYSEPWQLVCDNIAAEYVCGNGLFPDFVNTKTRAEQVLITDPVVTRLWLLTLFFSTPLHCYYNKFFPEINIVGRKGILQIQESYITLLWKYLIHRHGDLGAIHIFSNLIGIYLRMQRISQAVNGEIRTRNDLLTIHEAFNRAVVIESDNK